MNITKTMTLEKTSLTLTREPKDYGKVAVLYGGLSAEREVSLCSGEAVYSALVSAGIDAIKIDTAKNFPQSIMDSDLSRAFIALHGRGGEDGVVQGFLKTLGIPFTGSGVAGASISMDKLQSKRIFQQAKLLTANFRAVRQDELFTEKQAEQLFEMLGPDLFVKPIKEGSSVGMSKVSTVEALLDAVNLAHQYDKYALIESYIVGKEYTVSILKGVALPSICMETPREFYDYKAKYESTATQYFCPSGLDIVEEKELKALALSAFELLGCRGWGRVDFIRDGSDGDFFILEANTVPGMTEASLVPKAANAVGISFQDLVLHILDTSFINTAVSYE